jgi:hypothetical protein
MNIVVLDQAAVVEETWEEVVEIGGHEKHMGLRMKIWRCASMIKAELAREL